MQRPRARDLPTPTNVSMGYDIIDEDEGDEEDNMEWTTVSVSSKQTAALSSSRALRPLPVRSRPVKTNPARPEINECLLPNFKRLPAATRPKFGILRQMLSLLPPVGPRYPRQ